MLEKTGSPVVIPCRASRNIKSKTSKILRLKRSWRNRLLPQSSALPTHAAARIWRSCWQHLRGWGESQTLEATRVEITPLLQEIMIIYDASVLVLRLHHDRHHHHCTLLQTTANHHQESLPLPITTYHQQPPATFRFISMISPWPPFFVRDFPATTGHQGLPLCALNSWILVDLRGLCCEEKSQRRISKLLQWNIDFPQNQLENQLENQQNQLENQQKSNQQLRTICKSSDGSDVWIPS